MLLADLLLAGLLVRTWFRANTKHGGGTVRGGDSVMEDAAATRRAAKAGFASVKAYAGWRPIRTAKPPTGN